ALQRLRRAGGVALCRHGPPPLFLMPPTLMPPPLTLPSRRRPYPWLEPGVLAGALVPVLAIAVRGVRGGLGANPIAEALNQLGLVALALLLATLACTPAKVLFGWTWPLRIR